LPDVSAPSPNTVKAALAGLGDLEWHLHSPPWRYFLLTQDADNSWKMRSEDRTKAVHLGGLIQRWRLGLYELDEAGVADFKRQWSAMLSPAQTDAESDKLWEQWLEA
jgi:hypothetical protein